MSNLFHRQTLDQLCDVPDDIIDVYVVERHIWQGGTVDSEAESKRKRRAEPRTVRDFLIDPVRSLLNDVLRQLAAPYDPSSKANPIGQGWWIQAEFGSGKSHLLSFIGAVALGDKKVWETVNELETKAKKGKRESLYQFYDSGLAKKSTGKSRGIFVAVKTLVGQGGGTIGVTDTGRKLTEYILDAVQDQYHAENGKTISVYPVEVLADRFEQDIDRYRKDLGKFLKDPKFFDEEEQEDLDKFLYDLRSTKSQTVRRDCGQKLWRFYTEYLQVTPKLPGESEEVLKFMVESLLAQGYEGLLLILDEVSLFMKNRTDEQRVEDEKTLVVLTNRLAKTHCLPVWTICSAQQALESKMGVKNIIANDRLKNVSLLQDETNFYDIVLSRVRNVTQPNSVGPYFEDYHKGFTWPDAIGSETFRRFFPFFKPAIDVLRAVSYNLTTLRSSVHFMHQTLKTQRKAKSNELITLWQMFDDVVSYEEDPSGTTAGIAAISSKFNEEFKAYQAGRRIIGQATKGRLKVYHARCEKILKTLFLYYIAKMQPNGLSVEEVMNSVMEWADHDKGQKADIKDNLDHYEVLLDELAKEIPQVKKAGKNFVFNPEGGGVDVKELFAKARSASEGNDAKQRDAWNQLLALDGWEIKSTLLTMDLARSTKSLFRGVAPAEQKDFEVEWHGRTIKGRVYMRDLLDIASKGQALPPINSPNTDHDFAVFISNRPCGDKVTDLAKKVGDPRTLFWTPGQLTSQERDRLLDFAAYRELVKDYQSKDTEDAKEVVVWVANRLRDEIGSIAKIVADSFGRGQISAADHSSMSFNCQGELLSILTPLVGHVLDGVYASKSIQFDAPAPFNDAEAIKVINGVVKTGDIPKGTKPNQFTSAADNYGYALGVMKKDGTKQLNTKGNEFVEDLDEWIETQTTQGNQNISVETVCKNFTGLGGPNDKNYGLSRRMIDVYLLCLVREGKLRILLSGKGAVDALDYTNVVDQTFNAALLNSMAKIQRLKAPDGWPVLAPFAAILLDDESLKTIQKDGDITTALDRLKKWRAQQRPEVETLIDHLDTLMADIQQPNPVADTLGSWQKFLTAKIDDAEAISHQLNAFDTAFGYTCYADQEAKGTELDDLATRKKTWEKAVAFCRHDQKIRAAHRYSQLTVEKSGPVGELKDKLRTLGKKLGQVQDLMESEAKLQSQLLDLLDGVQGVYKTRYLQAFNEVTGKCEAVRSEIDGLSDSRQFLAIAELAKIDALASVDVSALKGEVTSYKEVLFQSPLDHNAVERALKDRPQPEGCPLHVDEAEQFVTAAEEALGTAKGEVQGALQNMASLLRQPALRSLLEQGKQEKFVASVLAAPNEEKLVDILAECVPADPGNAKLLAKYLKRIIVKVVHLHDFQPTKTKVEKADIESVVSEFRRFLETAVDGDGKGQFTILEIK
ncbi:hypothetical protein [Fimbriiglobus ruber]|uniref:Uncharacterized protein n=1 Tax=Fimbriiglobus ruber TaxID=1908690 RepID=A0A225DVV1_9BACT|nr:hypothetical protein [Fimbriiglobus ruber]OWK45511.1 hypothetical protein FRUB_01842 [Fimbriiglobus ruber]